MKISLSLGFFLATLKSKSVAKSSDALTIPVPNPGYWYSAEGSEAYFEARSKCKWSVPISAPEFWGESFLYTDVSRYNEYWFDAGRSSLSVQECHVPEIDREGNIWIIRRVGPFTTTGGAKEGEWHQIKFHEAVRKRWITGTFAGRVNEEGTLFSSPPLHVHHEHISYTENLPSYVRASPEILGTYSANRIFVSHGDNYFVEADGGVIGNAYKSYPKGYGKRMEEVYYFDNKIGDIRPPNSPALKWWTELAYRYTLETPRRELMHMSRFNMANFFENVKFHIPDDTGSLFWFAWKMPADGEFESNWCHTHGAEHIIIFKGDPKKFALGHKYAKRNAWTPKPVDNVHDVANELIKSATEEGIGHCKGNIQWEGEEIRMTQFNCKPWKFVEGEIATIVSLYDPLSRPSTNLRQHLIFRGDWFPNKPSIVDQRPELRLKNAHSCGENPNQCVSELTLGFKIYLVVVNFGFIPEYCSYKAGIGWLVLIGLISAIIFGIYQFSKWLSTKISPAENTTAYDLVFLDEIAIPVDK